MKFRIYSYIKFRVLNEKKNYPLIIPLLFLTKKNGGEDWEEERERRWKHRQREREREREWKGVEE